MRINPIMATIYKLYFYYCIFLKITSQESFVLIKHYLLIGQKHKLHTMQINFLTYYAQKVIIERLLMCEAF